MFSLAGMFGGIGYRWGRDRLPSERTEEVEQQSDRVGLGVGTEHLETCPRARSTGTMGASHSLSVLLGDGNERATVVLVDRRTEVMVFMPIAALIGDPPMAPAAVACWREDAQIPLGRCPHFAG
jgi:hypothetical protein